MLRLQHITTVDEAIAAIFDLLRERLGNDALDRLLIGAASIVGLVLLYAAYGLVRMLQHPTRTTTRRDANATKGSHKSRRHTAAKTASSQQHQPPTSEPQTPSLERTAGDNTVKPTRNLNSARSRSATAAACSPLKGIPLLGGVACSADGGLIVAASREKRIARVYPQYTTLLQEAKSFMGFTTIDEVPSTAVITSVVFDSGRHFCLLDAVNMKAYIFTYRFDVDSAASSVFDPRVTFVRTTVIPPGPLSDTTAEYRLSNDAMILYAMHSDGGYLDVIDLLTGEHRGSAKVKAGNTACWGHAADGTVFAAGSYIKTIRGFRVTLHPGHNNGAVTLNMFTSIASDVRVHRMALSADGSRLAAQMEGPAGEVRIWALDVDYGRDERPLLLSCFNDADYADCTHLELTYLPSGSTSRRRDILLILAKGGDAVVYRVAKAQTKETPTSTPSLACEVHDAHDGEPIRWLGIGCRGAALATAAEVDARNAVRLWPIKTDS